MSSILDAIFADLADFFADFSGLRASGCIFLKVFFNTEFFKSPFVSSR